jgi:hypothetical protein
MCRTVTNLSALLLNVSALFALAPSDGALGRPEAGAPEAWGGLQHCSACVLVADGAGDFRAASKAICEAVGEEHLPLDIETFPWSHGYCRILSDQIDHSNIRLQGQRLAERILALRGAFPHLPIHLVGHSAGCAVVLTAAELLPAGAIQRVILLAPSVPTCYDLRPALRSVQDGMDVFFSPEDNWYLRVGMFVTHITAPSERSAAGHFGFKPVVETPEDGQLYAKLTHYPWEPRLSWTGHYGGHFGCYQQKFLRVFVLPLLTSEPEAGRAVCGDKRQTTTSGLRTTEPPAASAAGRRPVSAGTAGTHG